VAHAAPGRRANRVAGGEYLPQRINSFGRGSAADTTGKFAAGKASQYKKLTGVNADSKKLAPLKFIACDPDSKGTALSFCLYDAAVRGHHKCEIVLSNFFSWEALLIHLGNFLACTSIA
jgi:hypothetical protein